MKELELFKRQFLLTVYENLNLPWPREKILNYNLFYHPDLEFEHVVNKSIELYLLGFIFDFTNPDYSNKQILESLSKTSSFDYFLEKLSEHSGNYAIIYKSHEKFILLNDACAQQEIYYDISFSSFGTQPKLLSRVIHLSPHSSADALKFYSSSAFLSKKLFIGTTTHSENIIHLLPNHLISILNKKVIRFFPKSPINPISIKEASTEVITMLKGFIKAASIRYKIAMGVTGGFDTRIMFLASLDVDCKFYVSKLSHMDYKHSDIVIPQKLTKIFNKEFKIISESQMDEYENLIEEMSVDFSRNPNKPDKEFYKHVLINGNISEIARNYFCYYQKILPEELAILCGYPGNKFVTNEYGKWLRNNSEIFSEMGYRVLDLFYWELRMGTWAAKAKTEMSALGTIIYSPFCCHKLIITLLSTPKKYRDNHFSKLYYLIIKECSPEAVKIPVNPSRTKSIKLILKTLKILNTIQIIRLKFKLMNSLKTNL